MQYVFMKILRSPDNIATHLEPCGAHGVSLAKSRSAHGKKSAAGLNSFSRFLRDYRSGNDFNRAVAGVIESDGVTGVMHAITDEKTRGLKE